MIVLARSFWCWVMLSQPWRFPFSPETWTARRLKGYLQRWRLPALELGIGSSASFPRGSLSKPGAADRSTAGVFVLHQTLGLRNPRGA